MKHKETISPQEIVREGLAKIRLRNSQFSNNALARSVGVSPSFISQFLNGKKSLSPETAHAISRVLKLTMVEERALVPKEIKKIRLNEKELVHAIQYREMVRDHELFLNRWYHLAILELTLCDNYIHSVEWISQRLGINISDTVQAIKRLVRMGLLAKNKSGQWVKTHEHLKISTKCSHAHIRAHHSEMMKKASEYMETHLAKKDFADREIRGRVLPVNKKNLPKASKLIKDFMNELTQLVDDGSSKDVYQLGIQFFPLTKELKK